MKIAFHLNCLTHGGAERVVTNLAGQFAEHGDEVIVATEWTDPNEYELHPSCMISWCGKSRMFLSRSRERPFTARFPPAVGPAFRLSSASVSIRRQLIQVL